MPYYEYQCQSCATDFTVKRSFDQAHDAAACPECNSSLTKKRLSTVAHISNGGMSAPASIPMSMSAGGCGCGGSCACSA